VRDSWPLLVWLGMVVVTAQTYRAGIAFKRMNGVVTPVPAVAGAAGGTAPASPMPAGVYPEAVTPVETGVLSEVLVRQGQPVRRGDVVARMDTSAVDAEIEEFKEQQMEDRLQRLGRLRSDLLAIEDEGRQLQMESASDGAELEAVRRVLGELEDVLADGVLGDDFTQNLRVAVAPLSARLELYPRLQRELEDTAATLRSAIEDTMAAIGSAAGPATGTVAQLERQRELMNLRASHDGIVYLVDAEAGEVVSAGQPVLRIIPRPEEIIAFLPQEECDRVQAGMTVWVASTADRHSYHLARVTQVPPQVLNLADPASNLQNRRVHGRRVHVSLPESADLLPGQTVVVHLEKPGHIPLIGGLVEALSPRGGSAGGGALAARGG
jgi:multidrug resistance efflux pump